MQQLANILPDMISSLGINKKYKSNLIIFHWQKIVGNDVALQSTPICIEYGVLFLSVKNSVWSHHLAMMKDEVIQKINNFVEDCLVRDIRFKNHLYSKTNNLKEEDSDLLDLAKELNKIMLSPQEILKSHQECSFISDEAIKKRILNVYQKNLKFNKYKKLQGWHECNNCETLCEDNEEYCKSCALIQRQNKMISIQRELNNVPWATYGEINKYIKCSAHEYIDAKVSLLQQIANSLGVIDESSLQAKTLTMLFNGARYEDLSPKLIRKTVTKFRRNNYVSSSRV